MSALRSIPALLATALLLAACGSATPSASRLPVPAETVPTPASGSPDAEGQPPASAAASPAESLAAAPSDDVLGPFSCDMPVDGSGTAARAQITDVRVGTHDGYDRIVFEFMGEGGADAIPPFTVEQARPPFTADGSGLPIAVGGDEFLRVYLFGGSKRSPTGGITYTGPTRFGEEMPRLDELVESGDFEDVSTWIAGLNEGDGCYRVAMLSAPSRLVIDLEH